ncbi:MAG: hypothetical protein M3409_01475 [Gemmatimonadota bacterium]|nr:hypothetical protein [Gemmatimonadota bacterium]
MRSLRDDQGNSWDVSVGRESWGAQMLLFARRDSREFRSVGIAAEARLGAEQELAALSEADLRERFAEAAPWEPG